MFKVGLLGFGYWGPNMARNILDNPELELSYICDIDQISIKHASERYPQVECVDIPDIVIEDRNVDIVIIATPVNTHYQLTLDALNNGKHVLVEKPMTDTHSKAVKLVNTAESNNLILMVDHTFIYSSAVAKIKEIVTSGELGELLYFDSTRINLGLFQHDINVIWDLAPHDFSILNYIIDDDPIAISAYGVSFFDKQHESIAYINLAYKSGFIAHFHVNWLAPVKIRQTIIGGSKKMLVYNDMEPTEKIKIYDKGVNITNREGIYKTLVQYRTGDIHIPHIENNEPLKTEINHFVDCLKNKRTPITDGRAGEKVVKILEASQKSITNNGIPIQLK